MEPTFLLIKRGARNSETLILLRESASGKKPLSPLAHGTLFCLSPGSLSSRALRSGVKNKKQTCGKPLKRGFSPHQTMNTPTETSDNHDLTVIMPKETVIKHRIRLPTKRGWAAMKVADLFRSQKTLRELCRDHGAPLHLARHHLYQTKK